MSWKVLITARAAEEVGQPAYQLLRQSGCELVLPPKFGPLSADDVQGFMAGCDAALCSADKYTPAVLEHANAANLKCLSRWGVGYDSIDIATATRLGIVVAFTPGMLDGAVADYTWALLFALARRVHEGHIVMRDNRWTVAWGHDVSNKTLGIIGCGRIGQAVAKRAAGFNMTILGHDIAPNPHAEALGVKFVSLDELLSRSDFVSLNCALKIGRAHV